MLQTVAAPGDPDPLVVQIAALALLGPEQLVHDGVVGHPGDDLARAVGRAPLQPHRDGEVGHGVHEVGGAVDRIDDPGVGLVGPLDHAALFTQEAVARAGLHQQFVQGVFGAQVGGRD